MKMEQIECSETSAYINQTPGNYPKENTLYSEHGESLKSRINFPYSRYSEVNFCKRVLWQLIRTIVPSSRPEP